MAASGREPRPPRTTRTPQRAERHGRTATARRNQPCSLLQEARRPRTTASPFVRCVPEYLLGYTTKAFPRASRPEETRRGRREPEDRGESCRVFQPQQRVAESGQTPEERR